MKNFMFDSKSFACPCCGVDQVDARILSAVQTIQFGLQEQLVITSGFRCEKHNAAVGGVPGSQHTLGLAADIACTDAGKRYAMVKMALSSGVRGIEITKKHLHLDFRAGDQVLVIA